MKLREFLVAYESVDKIYINDGGETYELFTNLLNIPEEYLNSKVEKWTNKIDCGVIGTNSFKITPVVTLA